MKNAHRSLAEGPKLIAYAKKNVRLCILGSKDPLRSRTRTSLTKRVGKHTLVFPGSVDTFNRTESKHTTFVLMQHFGPNKSTRVDDSTGQTYLLTSQYKYGESLFSVGQVSELSCTRHTANGYGRVEQKQQ